MAEGSPALRRAVIVVALANLAYFGVEFTVGWRIGSVSLFADSVDFLEDALVNVLIAVALGWSVLARARLGMVLAAVLLIPGIATVAAIWHQITSPVVPAPVPLSVTGLGALIVNLGCALLLARFRHHSGSLTRAAFLSARNDAYANLAIIGAGGVTAWVYRSAWPDLVVGAAIALLNADAAREVWQAARREHEAIP